jgi:hypothetical protein
MGITPAARVKLLSAILAVVAATGLAGCDKPAPTAASTLAPPTSQASPTPSGPPPAATGASDYCALAIKILTESGLMVNNRIISPLEETLDNLKAVVNLTLAAKDLLLAGLPANVRPALLVELQYFQSLKDHDFSSSTPAPAGLDAAIKTVNAYGAATCGFTFES